MKIADKTVVQMHYTLTSDEGKVIDSSEGREPLQYIQGAHMIVVGLEKAMVGHEVGDRLIRKAAESLRRIESRNIMAFRTGGDEFILIALHVSREEAEEIREKWEAGLEELNRKDDGIRCVIACGFAYGENGYNLDEIFSQADERMYEDKKVKKLKGGQPPAR